MKIIIGCLFTLAAASSLCPAVAAPDGGGDKSEMLGLGIVRQISNDICLPATAEEYEELGKHAILALDSTSVISTELPLRSVFVIYKDVRIPLQKITSLPKNLTKDGATQVSFYLLPIKYMKSDAKLFADFSGDRKEFGITTFTESEGLDPEAPAFARLDAYDTPYDPDMGAVEKVILREYPQHFSQSNK